MTKAMFNRGQRLLPGLSLRMALGIALGLAAGPLAAEVYLLDAEGTVQEVDVGESTVIITGFRYRAGPDADIEVAGRSSSLAGLAAGMKVRFAYEMRDGIDAQVADDAMSRIIELEQLPDSYQLEEF